MEAGGKLLAGRYQLGRPLGAGALGQVVEAYDRTVGRRVAVKMAHAQLAGDAEARAGFLRAAREAARLDHPNTVRLLDAGKDQGVPFVVMELVEGRSVRELLRTGGVPPVERAVEIAAQVCSALGAAHAQGVVHGGLTPGNILVGQDGRVQVADFGLAALALPGAPDAVRYRSPEQVQSGRADDRSDLYALGCCLFELLTGEPPFDGPTPFAVMRRHVEEEPRPPSAVRPEVPAELDELVLRALAKHPHERQQAAAELRHGLAQLRRRAAAPPQPVQRATAPAPDLAPRPAAIPMPTPVPVAAVSPTETEEAPGPRGPALAAASPTEVEEAPGPRGPALPAAGGAQVEAAAEPVDAGSAGPDGRDAEPAGAAVPWTVLPPPGSGHGAAARPAPVRLPPHEERVRALTRFAEPPRSRRRFAAAALAVGLAVLVVATIGLVAPGLVVDVGPGAASDATTATTTLPAAAPASTAAPSQVPQLTGVTSAEAARRLQAAGARVGKVRLARNTGLPKGLVVATAPAAGAALRQGQAVDLTVSNGSDPATVADLIAVIDEGPPSKIGPRGRAFRGRLAKLATLRGERRRQEIADLLRIARAGAGNGDFTADFSRKAVEVLSRTE